MDAYIHSNSDYDVISNANMTLGHSPAAMRLPGIDPKTRLEATRLCARDILEHHIFFNEIQFHNHLIHHLLATFSMGASAQRLQQIFDLYKSIQRPALPRPDKVDITAETLSKYFSQDEHYQDYIVFFQKELADAGAEWKSVAAEYFFDPKVLPLSMSGLFHPLIQFGYGLEFESQTITATGLAMAYTHCVGYKRMFQPKVFDQICANKNEANGGKGMSLWQIISAVRKDSLNAEIMFTTDLHAVIGNSVPEDLAIKYSPMWNVELNEASISAKYAELLSVIAHIFGSTTQPQYVYRYEFFIMHLLTSAYFLPILFEALSIERKAMLLHAHSAMTIALFAAVGSPDITTTLEMKSIDTHAEYTKLNPPVDGSKGMVRENPWFDVFDKAIASDDMHVAKVVRSLWRGDMMSAFTDQPTCDQEYELPPRVNWLYIADCVLASVTASSFEDSETAKAHGKRSWARGMIGRHEFWTMFGERSD